MQGIAGAPPCKKNVEKERADLVETDKKMFLNIKLPTWNIFAPPTYFLDPSLT